MVVGDGAQERMQSSAKTGRPREGRRRMERLAARVGCEGRGVGMVMSPGNWAYDGLRSGVGRGVDRR